jgi:hypothetical protein
MSDRLLSMCTPICDLSNYTSTANLQCYTVVRRMDSTYSGSP